MLGSELFDAYKDKRETTVNVDLKFTSKAQLKAHMVNEYGEALTEQIWSHWNSNGPKVIEHQPPIDIGCEPLDCPDTPVNEAMDGDDNQALESSREPPSRLRSSTSDPMLVPGFIGSKWICMISP